MSAEKAVLLSEMEEYRVMPAGWDGETDAPTSPECLDTAERFIRLLPADCPLPELSCGTGDEVSLFWDMDAWLKIQCLPEGGIRLYWEKGGESIAGNFGMDAGIPGGILSMIRRLEKKDGN